MRLFSRLNVRSQDAREHIQNGTLKDWNTQTHRLHLIIQKWCSQGLHLALAAVKAYYNMLLVIGHKTSIYFVANWQEWWQKGRALRGRDRERETTWKWFYNFAFHSSFFFKAHTDKAAVWKHGFSIYYLNVAPTQVDARRAQLVIHHIYYLLECEHEWCQKKKSINESQTVKLCLLPY